jgi:hypothetical protein
MKRVAWMGWLVAGLLLLENAATGLAAPAEGNPLEGTLLQHSTGAFYVVHGGLKFAVQVAEISDPVIEAIPTASSSQWEALFANTSNVAPVLPSRNPQPFPGYS